MAEFARKASELVREIASSDEDQLLPFNADVVNQVIQEEHDHHEQVVNTLLKVQQSGVDWDEAAIPEAAAVLVHHQALLRNKRCLMTYLHHRMARIRKLRWQLGAVLPAELQEKLSTAEKEYFRSYSESLAEYMMGIEIDLTVDMAPPKDPYIEVRVLKNAGTMMMDDKVTHLEQNTVHLVRRSEAEPLIRKGIMEHREF